jgi:hypothetical protein
LPVLKGLLFYHRYPETTRFSGMMRQSARIICKIARKVKLVLSMHVGILIYIVDSCCSGLNQICWRRFEHEEKSENILTLVKNILQTLLRNLLHYVSHPSELKEIFCTLAFGMFLVLPVTLLMKWYNRIQETVVLKTKPPDHIPWKR